MSLSYSYKPLLTQVLLNLTRPYRKVTMSFLARELAMAVEDVEEILVDLILDDRLVARINQTSGHVTLSGSSSVTEQSSLLQMNSLARWADTLTSANDNFASRLMM